MEWGTESRDQGPAFLLFVERLSQAGRAGAAQGLHGLLIIGPYCVLSKPGCQTRRAVVKGTEEAQDQNPKAPGSFLGRWSNTRGLPRFFPLRKMTGCCFDRRHPQAQVYLEPQAQRRFFHPWPPGGRQATAAPLVLGPQSQAQSQAPKWMTEASVPLCPLSTSQVPVGVS